MLTYLVICVICKISNVLSLTLGLEGLGEGRKSLAQIGVHDVRDTHAQGVPVFPSWVFPSRSFGGSGGYLLWW